MRCTSRTSSSVRRTSSLFRSMVSSGSTNSVWPLELAPWITPSSLRRWPAITGTTKRSLRMVTNSSCSTPSSRCGAGSVRAIPGWTSSAARCRGAGGPAPRWRGRRRVPSGRILPSRSLQQRAEIADGLRARAQAREALGDGGEERSWRRPRDRASAKTSKISLGSRLAPSMRSLWTAASRSGRPPKSMRMAAPRAAGCGRGGRAQIFDRLAGFGQVVVQARAIGVRLRPCPVRAGPAGSRRSGPASCRSASNSRTSALVFKAAHLYFRTFAKGFFNHRQRALGDLQIGQVGAPHPLDRADIVAGAELAAGDAAEVVDQHVVIFGRAGGIAHDALEDFQHAERLDLQAGLFAHFAADASSSDSPISSAPPGSDH